MIDPQSTGTDRSRQVDEEEWAALGHRLDALAGVKAVA